MAINPAEITTIRVGQLTPESPTLSSIISHELSDELKRCTIAEIVDLLNLNIGTLQYEIKTLYVDQEYIDTNFDSTGLGRLLCLGFAICNGNNGTFPFTGLVEVACDMATLQTYSVGNTDGSTDAVLVDHFHNYGLPLDAQSGGTSQQSIVESAGSDEKIIQFQTSSVGFSAVGKNMQPYICVLKIMKL
jgi:hypothetical protein